MYKIFLYLMFSPALLTAQINFGFRSGVGIYLDLFNANILAPKSELSREPILINAPDPREGRTIYYGLAHQHEFFVAKGKKQLKFAVAFARVPKPYNDQLGIYWGNNEDHRVIDYQLSYGYMISNKQKYSIDLQTGLIAEKFYVVRAQYGVAKDQNGYYVSGISVATLGKGSGQFDWGFPLEVNVNYKISENAGIGLQAKTYYLLGIGIQGLYAMPMLKVAF